MVFALNPTGVGAQGRITFFCSKKVSLAIITMSGPHFLIM